MHAATLAKSDEVMSLRDRIAVALKSAMKAGGDRTRVATLRLITAAIQDRDIAARTEDQCGGVSDTEILALLAKMVRQREESSAAFESGGRPDLAEQEQIEIDVIRGFLPRQLDSQEIEAAVAGVIAECGATGLKDMGRCMNLLKQRYPGAIDASQVGALIKRNLA